MLKRLFLAAAALTGVVANEDFSSLNLHGKGLLTIDNINITRVGGIQPFSLSSWFQIHIDNPESASDQMQTLVALRGMEGSEKEMWRFGINTVNILNKTHTSLRLELNLPLTFTSISSPTYIVPLNTPVHVMMTWNGTLALYVNNIVTTYTPTWTQHQLTSTTMYIGATGYDSKANSGVGIPILPFVGTIQSLAYHANALSSNDVNLIYEHGPYFNQTILSSSIYPTIIYIFTPTHTSLNYTTGVYTFTPITFNTSFIAPIAISSGCNELKNSRLEYGRVGALYFRCPDEPQVTRPPTTPVPTTAAPTTQAPTTVTPTTQTPTTTSAPTTTPTPTTTSTPTSSDGTTSTPTTTTSPSTTTQPPSTTTTPPSTTTTPTSPSSTGTSSTNETISSSIPSSTTSVTSIDSFSSNNNINGTESSTGGVGSSTGGAGSSSDSNVVTSSTGTTTTSPTTSLPTTSSPTTPGVIDDIPSSTGDAIFSSSSTGSNNTISISSASMTTSHGMITVAVVMGLAMLL